MEMRHEATCNLEDAEAKLKKAQADCDQRIADAVDYCAKLRSDAESETDKTKQDAEKSAAQLMCETETSVSQLRSDLGMKLIDLEESKAKLDKAQSEVGVIKSLCTVN